jgi:hypothetical protein
MVVSSWLRSSPRRPRRVRPWIEGLEVREAPAVFNVAAGDVPGLIAAIN